MLEPLAKREWTPARAAHLLNRAGFGGSPRDIAELIKLGPALAVQSLVEYETIPYSPPPPDFAEAGPIPLDPMLRQKSTLSDEERRKRNQMRRREQFARLAELRDWWLRRMLESPRPLEEKLTLFWHGHFATSVIKVKSVYAMYVQNTTLRTHAGGSFEDLTLAVTRDPAMLNYLDGTQSQREAPNENYARELMELFTLGEGHYTEQDIQEAARALSGWTTDRRTWTARFLEQRHDDGRKEFLDEEGRFDDKDIVRILVRRPECAQFICRKLWTFFAYEDPEESTVDALATVFRQNDYDLKPVLKTMFMSRAFYSVRAGRTQIKSPVQWLIGSLKYTESPLPDPQLCTFMLDRLGQRLFEPPNVKGWEGGYTWITAATLVDRYNFAGVLAKGSDEMKELGGDPLRQGIRRLMSRSMMNEDMEEGNRAAQRDRIQARLRQIRIPVLDPDRILPAADRTSAEKAHSHLQLRMFQAHLRDQDWQALDSYFKALPEPSEWTDEQIRDAVHAMMSTPQYQLT